MEEITFDVLSGALFISFEYWIFILTACTPLAWPGEGEEWKPRGRHESSYPTIVSM